MDCPCDILLENNLEQLCVSVLTQAQLRILQNLEKQAEEERDLQPRAVPVDLNAYQQSVKQESTLVLLSKLNPDAKTQTLS